MASTALTQICCSEEKDEQCWLLVWSIGQQDKMIVAKPDSGLAIDLKIHIHLKRLKFEHESMAWLVPVVQMRCVVFEVARFERV